MANVSRLRDFSENTRKINASIFTADGGSDDEESAEKSTIQSEAAKESESSEPPLIEPSRAMKELLIALEFNSIDMYN